MGTKTIHNDDESTIPLLNDNPSTTDTDIDNNHQSNTHDNITPIVINPSQSLGTTPSRNTQHDTSNFPNPHVVPSNDMNTKTTTTTAATNDDERYCRICGEGEEDEDDQDGSDSYYCYNGQGYDEESLINDPILPSTSMITQQEPPSNRYTQLTTRYQSNSSSQEDHIDTFHQQQQQQQQHTASTSTTTIPPSPRHGVNAKKWIQQSNPLIRPCRCKGTMMYVHVSCLNRWRTLSPRASSYVACDLCGYEYNIYRPRYAACLTNVHFLRLMTAFLVILSIMICSYLVKFIDVYGLDHLPQPDDENWLELHGPTWLWMDRFYLFAGLVVVSLLGMSYLVFLCATRPDQLAYLLNPSIETGAFHTTNVGGGCLCCDQSSCPWYSCYLADFAACSGDAAAGGFLIFIVMMSLLAILFGVLGAVTGVFRLMESLVDRVAGHIKEKILDVD